MQVAPVALPFVLEHGDLVWKAALGLWVTLIVIAVLLVRRWRAREASRLRATALATRGTPLRGTLRGSASGPLLATLDARLGLHRPGEPDASRASWRSSDVWLETPDGRVDFEGVPDIEVGTMAVVTRNGAPSAVSDELLAIAQKRASWVHRVNESPQHVLQATLRTLRAGDEVVVIGAREPAPTHVAAGYRETEPAWIVRATEDGPLTIGAVRPYRELARASVISLLLLAGVWGLVGYVIERGLGSRWIDTCAAQPDDAPLDLSLANACVRTAATPNYREISLERLATHARDVSPPTRHSASLAVSLAAKVGTCSTRIALALEHFDYESARQIARSCGDRRAEHLALTLEGQFGAASALPVPAEDGLERLPTVQTLIAAGRFLEAAERIDERAVERATRTDGEPEQRMRSVRHDQCLAALLRVHGGRTDALVELRGLHASPNGDKCAPMLVEAVPPSDRPAMIATLRGDRQSDFETEVVLSIQALLEDAGPQDTRDAILDVADSPESLLINPDEASARDLAHLYAIDLVAARLVADPRVHGTVLRWLAAARTFDGDLDTARALALRASNQALHTEIDAYRDADRAFLSAAIALYSPSTTPPIDFEHPPGIEGELAANKSMVWRLEFGRLLLRAGQPATSVRWLSEYASVLAAAQQGDGLPLALFIGRRQWWSDGDVTAVLPRVRNHRDVLTEALEVAGGNASSPGSQSYRYPFSLVSKAVERRTMFELAGNTEAAALWHARYVRVDSMLADRRRLIALMLLDT